MKIGVLTISDKGSRGERLDASGEAIADAMRLAGAEVPCYAVIPDEKDLICGKLKEWADSGQIDAILTTGGTGLGPRDVTPEATTAVIDRVVPGFTEAMRSESLKKTPHAMLSRAVCGTRGTCLIINLPGSPKAVRECLAVVLPALPHAVDTIKGAGNECAEL